MGNSFKKLSTDSTTVNLVSLSINLCLCPPFDDQPPPQFVLFEPLWAMSRDCGYGVDPDFIQIRIILNSNPDFGLFEIRILNLLFNVSQNAV